MAYIVLYVQGMFSYLKMVNYDGTFDKKFQSFLSMYPYQCQNATTLLFYSCMHFMTFKTRFSSHVEIMIHFKHFVCAIAYCITF